MYFCYIYINLLVVSFYYY